MLQLPWFLTTTYAATHHNNVKYFGADCLFRQAKQQLSSVEALFEADDDAHDENATLDEGFVDEGKDDPPFQEQDLLVVDNGAVHHKEKEEDKEEDNESVCAFSL